MSNLVIYHGKCYDGLTAAWVARRALGPDTEFHSAIHGEAPPDVVGKNVYILDFCYPRHILEGMKFVANDLRVIDHHKTAMEDCRDLDFCIFNMERSGAGMAWEYFFYDEPCPDWILRIEDRDLWKFVYPDTKTIQAYISSLPLTFENWDELNNTPIETMVKNGKAIERYIESYCERAAQEARKIEWPPGVRGVTVNVPYQAASEMASYLLTQHKDCVFSMGWFQRGDGKVQFSLRSRGDYDVSEVAKMVGGGGHRSAAGFALPLGEALDILSRKAT